MTSERERTRSADYLALLGVRELRPLTSPFDPGYDPLSLESHLAQSSHLMATLKLSMMCWLVAREGSTRQKVEAAHAHGVVTVAGGGPFEIAIAQGVLGPYLDLCAEIGFDRIECGEGFTEVGMEAREIVDMAAERGLDVQFELGKKHGGPFKSQLVRRLIEQGERWMEAGARELVVEARESAAEVGLFGADGKFNSDLADRFADAFGLDNVTFEAPNKASQFALLNHFGPEVRLSNVRLDELLRVEIYRRGLHSDSFGHENLRPRRLRV
jgi:phosphosulfolactate synthase